MKGLALHLKISLNEHILFFFLNDKVFYQHIRRSTIALSVTINAFVISGIFSKYPNRTRFKIYFFWYLKPLHINTSFCYSFYIYKIYWWYICCCRIPSKCTTSQSKWWHICIIYISNCSMCWWRIYDYSSVPSL